MGCFHAMPGCSLLLAALSDDVDGVWVAGGLSSVRHRSEAKAGHPGRLEE